MGKTIEKIWKDELELAPYFGVTNKKLVRLEKQMFRKREELESILEEKQKEIYDKYIEYLDDVNYETLQEAFTEGFSIGVKVAAEALINAERLTEKA